jgi:hypothetical protein
VSKCTLKIQPRRLTLARTFSKDAGLTREKHIRKTSYKEGRKVNNRTRNLRHHSLSGGMIEVVADRSPLDLKGERRLTSCSNDRSLKSLTQFADKDVVYYIQFSSRLPIRKPLFICHHTGQSAPGSVPRGVTLRTSGGSHTPLVQVVLSVPSLVLVVLSVTPSAGRHTLGTTRTSAGSRT